MAMLESPDTPFRQKLPPGPGMEQPQSGGGGMPQNTQQAGMGMMQPQQPQPAAASDDGPDQGLAMLIQSRMENMGIQVVGQFEQALLQADKTLLQLLAMAVPELGVAFNAIGSGAQQGQQPEPDADEQNPLINDMDDDNELPVGGGGQSRFAAQYPG